MDQFRALFAIIRKNLGALTSTQKLLIGSLGIIMLMTLFLVSQYAGKVTMVPLMPGASAEDQQKAAVLLRNTSIKIVEAPTGIMVPTEKREDAFALLAQSGNQPANTAIVFENLLKNQNWMNSREQNRQLYKVMLDNWLSGVLGKFGGIRQARVFVDSPEPGGIGSTARIAKASITLFTDTGRAVPQETVDAAARLVSGSVAGLDLQNVVVNDGTAGRTRKVITDGDMVPSTYREYASSVEKDFKTKIESLLRYMDPPAVVEVTATVDVTRVHAQETRYLAPNDGTVSLAKKETSSSTLDTQPSDSGEPGVRSNATASINSGGSRTSKSEQKQDESEMDNHVGSRIAQIDDPRGHPTRLVATIMVPRAYVAGLIQKEMPPPKEGEKAEPPAKDKVDARFDEERKAIESSLKPHVNIRSPEGQQVDGEVVVTLVSGEILASNTPGAGPGGGGSGSGGGGTAPGGLSGTLGTVMAYGSSGIVDRLALGALSVVAVGMMLFMVRRSGKRAPIPLAAELVGRPPTLEAKSDLVGEADETETAMAGIEVGEEQIKADKMREQVSELVRQNPDGAAKLLNRWISVED